MADRRGFTAEGKVRCRNCDGPADHFPGSQFDPHPECDEANARRAPAASDLPHVSEGGR